VNDKKLSPAEEIERDEQRLARQSVAEGQAMVVLLDYVLAPMGKSVANSPELVKFMQSEMLDSGSTPMFAAAPLYLRAGLTFPYMSGLRFAQRVLLSKGVDAAFTRTLKDPPIDTRQIMDPEAYLRSERTPPLKMADLESVLGRNWPRYDYGGFGEFDIDVIVQQWTGTRTESPLAKNWRGGYYMSFEPKPGAAANSPSSLCLAMVIRWADEASAREFDSIYRKALSTRYKLAKPNGAGVETDDGLVTSEVRGNLWLATESFDAPTAAKLREALAKAAATQ
jgi:hypothetical protein